MERRDARGMVAPLPAPGVCHEGFHAGGGTSRQGGQALSNTPHDESRRGVCRAESWLLVFVVKILELNVRPPVDLRYFFLKSSLFIRLNM